MTNRAFGSGMGCAIAALIAAGCASGTGSTVSKKDGGWADAAPAADGAGADSRAASAGTPDVGIVDGPSSPIDLGVDSPQVYPDAGLACGQTGAACQTAADCCGLACVAGLCSTSACLSDGTACTSDGQCCSTMCGVGGTCSPLNSTCKTAGNACTSDAQCCNQTCNANHQCAAPGAVSYCAQTGDICRGDGECCTGVCSIAAGAPAGTCASISTSCQIDGTVCSGCGDCCSHFCGPFGAAGPSICQPASGCHVQGDLCRKNSDCCGGDISSGLPGAGLIACEPDPVYGSRIGTCGGPRASNCPSGASTCKNACNPEGNVCHFKQTLVCAGDLTNVRNDCCDCISSKECCQPDATGIPRCNSLAACVPVGGNCSFSGECCGNEPCLPDPVTGKLTCGNVCANAGGACTTNRDCCTGMVCQATPGSIGGVCEVPTLPSAPDAGVGIDAPPVCAYYGQACSLSLPCCATAWRNTSGLACTATDLDCICFSPE